MNHYKICVYAICKNKEKFVERWMDAVSEADLVLVLDTGSKDSTAEKLRKRGAVVYEKTINPWRFDTARNAAMDLIPDEMDICLAIDLDMILRPGWLKQLEMSWTSEATIGNYLYHWPISTDGTHHTPFKYFEVHTKKDYRWYNPVYESLQYIGTSMEKKVVIDGMVLEPNPEIDQSLDSNLPLLEIALQENPSNACLIYQLGREYMCSSRWTDCIQTLKYHLELADVGCMEERSASMRWIAASYDQLGDWDEAYRWYYRAIAETPNMREAYIECAMMANRLEHWSTVLAMTSQALEITEKSINSVNMTYAWDYTTEDLAAIACEHLGIYQDALLHWEKALAMDPDNEKLKNKLELTKLHLQ